MSSLLAQIGIKKPAHGGLSDHLILDLLGSRHSGKKHCYQHRSQHHQSYAQQGQI
jgi:hypothetical protein